MQLSLRQLAKNEQFISGGHIPDRVLRGSVVNPLLLSLLYQVNANDSIAP
jgi:hypothetical protein